MSKVKFIDPVKEITGKFAKDGGIIMRKKKYKSENGIVLKEGAQEIYKIVNPRDYKKKPLKGGELVNVKKFTESKRIASEIINAGKYTEAELKNMTQEQQEKIVELKNLLEDYRKRFYAQFKRPDKEAPIEKNTNPNLTRKKRKQYVKLDNFIQAIIREKLTQNRL